MLIESTGQPYILGIPTVPFNASSDETYDLTRLHAIVIDVVHSSARDNDGLTTIPPTLWDFGETFRDDLAGIGIHAILVPGPAAADNTIFLTLEDDKSKFLNAAGKETSEGYALSVTSTGITLSGASPLGTWWGTRTVLQQAILNDKKMRLGEGLDAPGWSERGIMVNLGRPLSSSTITKTGVPNLVALILAGCRTPLLPSRLPR